MSRDRLVDAAISFVAAMLHRDAGPAVVKALESAALAYVRDLEDTDVRTDREDIWWVLRGQRHAEVLEEKGKPRHAMNSHGDCPSWCFRCAMERRERENA